MQKVRLQFILLSFYFVLIHQLNFSLASIDRTIRQTTVIGFGGKNLDVSSISQEYMNELFDSLKLNKSIPFRYIDDGCFARAHKMAMLLEDQGIITVKTFLIGDLRMISEDHPKGFVDWWYHVAPSVFVKDVGALVMFDPSAADHPISKKDWVYNLTSHPYGAVDEDYETVRFIYGPDDIRTAPNPTKYNQNDLVDMEEALAYFTEMLDERLGVGEGPVKLYSSENTTRVPRFHSLSPLKTSRIFMPKN